MQTLPVSRSSVSASLRELEERRLLGTHYVRGDRKQYYELDISPWEVFRIIPDDHKRRVIDPTVAAFKACLDKQTYNAPEDFCIAERTGKVISFFEAIICNELRRLPNDPIQNLYKTAEKIGEEIR